MSSIKQQAVPGLAGFLTLARKDKGLTQKEAAEHLGVSTRTYGRYELTGEMPTSKLRLALSFFDKRWTDLGEALDRADMGRSPSGGGSVDLLASILSNSAAAEDLRSEEVKRLATLVGVEEILEARLQELERKIGDHDAKLRVLDEK